MISHVPSWSVHIKKCQKKLGRDALNALCHWPWEMKEPRCSVISKEKKKERKKKLLAARRRNFYLSNKSWGFSIVRTMWHASWFSDSWIPTISDLCFCSRISELEISMGSGKQANYRVATILISLRFTYVSMITSAVWGHAWKGLFFSSPKLYLGILLK